MNDQEFATDDNGAALRGEDGRWLGAGDHRSRGTFPAHWPAPPVGAGPEARASWIADNAQRDEANANPHAVLARAAQRGLQLAQYAELLAKRDDPSL